MGWEIIKQPNGKYCIFSSVVDNVTYYNCTKDEIISAFVDVETKRIRKSVSETIEELDSGGKPYLQFSHTFDEMIASIRNIHSDKEAEEVLKLISEQK